MNMLDPNAPLTPDRVDDFEGFYRGTPPWDIGRPQKALQAICDAGAFRGAVLDVGCGTGEHALLAAERGLAATGVDGAPTAIERARAKARQRGLAVRFVVGDALALDEELGGMFDTIIDCGLFHVFGDPQRTAYVDALRAVTGPGSRLFLLCFSERVPGTAGPRRVTQAEIRAAFTDGWAVESIDDAVIETTMGTDIPSWLATITRT